MTVAVAAVCGAFVNAANAAFVFDDGGGNGFIVGSDPDFVLWGNDNDVGGIPTLYSDIADADGTFAFDWRYVTHDCCGASWDPAGFFINNDIFQLTNDGAPTGALLSGSISVSIAEGDEFGWFVYSVDGREGPAEFCINGGVGCDGFAWTGVPEPATLSLFGAALAGLSGLGTLRRRKRQA